MVVQLRGGGFKNKGAQLMLEAVIAQLRQWRRDVTLALNIRDGNARDRRPGKLVPLLWLDHWRLPVVRDAINGLLTRLPSVLLAGRAVLPGDTDVVLDLSGYSYGDDVGPNATKAAVEYYDALPATTRVVLLPQQLGPFNKDHNRRLFERLARRCTLIYARDALSYYAAHEVLGHSGHLKRAPDVTIPFPGLEPGGVTYPACIVPNAQMLARTEPAHGQAYMAFLETCVKELKAREIGVSIVLHEFSMEDARIARHLRMVAGETLPIVREQQPRRLKGILGQCDFTIGSRYHGLVSALSQGIPSLGAGWTHKYQTLFDEFGCPECLVRLDSDSGSWTEKLELVLNPQRRAVLAAKISDCGQVLIHRSQEMWDDLFRIIET